MTNEVLQKTASDEQNISSSNGLEPSLRFKNFTKKWNSISLKEIGTFQKGAPLSKADISQEGNPFILYGELYTTYSEVTYNVFRKTNKKVDKIYFSNVGDVILPTSGETPEEIATATCIMIPDVILAGDLYIFRQNKIDGRILSYIINHTVNGKISRIAQGKSVVHVLSEELGKIIINYPTNDEQQKIADFLSLIDQRIEKQRQLVESLKKYKRGLFLKLYNDSDKSIISFKNIYEMASEGGTPSTSDSENYENGKIPFIKIDDLNQHYLNFAKYFITEKGLKKSSAWIVPENSIIYSNGATIGACSINKIPVTTKQGILGIVPKSNFSVEFLYFLFTSSIFKQKIRAITTKGTMDSAYLKDINGIKISIPDFIAQQKIAKIMVDFENLIERTELSFIYLQNIKKALLQQMFI